MKKVRIIARLDVKGPNVIKGVQFECLRVIGKPEVLAEQYYKEGADELIYLDIVASLYRRQNLLNIVDKASEKIRIPITVGGGVRTLRDIQELLAAGADKVAINTAAIKNPSLINKAAKKFGSQCIVVSIEAKRKGAGWEAYTDNGREKTGFNAIQWAKEAEKRGAGEILLTSVDQEGTEKGYDIDLIKKTADIIAIPLIASGGAGSPNDFAECMLKTKANALASASLLHYHKITIPEIKKILLSKGFLIRKSKLPVLKKSRAFTSDIDDYNIYTLHHLKSLEKEKNKNIHIAKIKDTKVPENNVNADITIINYGINNLKSVARAFESLGKTIYIAKTPEEIEKAKCLILPGIGAFGDGMEGLKKRGLIETIKKRVSLGIPLLGICLGMQMLFTESEEFGLHKGLNLIKGKVIKFKPKKLVKYIDYKIPHVGWNTLMHPNSKNNNWKNTILENVKKLDEVYFVHSFYPKVNDTADILSITEYYGQKFCSAVRKENIFGTQFHPEKSGNVGLSILKLFCRYNAI